MNLKRIKELSDVKNLYSSQDMQDSLEEIFEIVSNHRNNRTVQLFIKAFETAKRKDWNKIYIGVDVHDTVLVSTWSTTLSSEYYPYAKECLQILSKREDICLILWSCSLPELNKQYSEFFKKDDINFDYINSNDECGSTEYADFETKLYFSVGLDDKFGFHTDDWECLHNYLTSSYPNVSSNN